MIKKIFFTIKRIVLLSHPKIWLYSGGLFLLGVALALSGYSEFLNISSISFALGFVLYFFWFLIMVNIFAFSLNDYFDREIDSKNFRKIKERMVSNEKDRLPVLIGIFAAIILFFLINFIAPNQKILFLGIFFFINSFLYSSPPIRAKILPIIDVLIVAAGYLVPLFAGYVFVSSKWPSFWMMIAGLFYFSALELYAKIIDIDSDEKEKVKTSAVVLGKRKSLLICFFLTIICGIILAFVGKLIYFLAIVPQLFIFVFSWQTKDYGSLIKIYSKTFIINNVWGALITSYFLIPILSKIFNPLL